MKRKEKVENPGTREDRKKKAGMESWDMTLMLFMAVMLGLCVAMPLFFGYMAPYTVGVSRFIPLESRYLGPGLFLLVHLAMIPLFFGKSRE
ncbi:MAG TPA: hypothetical protein VLN47_04765 [Clostridiaceae bacterium]|nr:hypothetical protein [Clostridiaceae bacterium]